MSEPVQAIDPGERSKARYSYADYLTWNDEQRWEIIHGEAWVMSPGPTSRHQTVTMNLAGMFWQYGKPRNINVFPAPFDVRLVRDLGKQTQADQDIFVIVQPDILVICDSAKLDQRGCLGAPDIVVEVLSPTTAMKDESQKLLLYEEYGVREYWIVNPDANYLMIYFHNGSGYEKPGYYRHDEIVESQVLPGLRVSMDEVFA